MNIGVRGLGSMGKRRIRLLKNLEQCGSIIGIDSREDRRIEAEEAFKISTECDLASAIKIHNLKALVVSTAPLSHAAIIKEGLKHKCHIFTEINLVATEYENNIKLAEENQCVLFLSSTPMYRKELQFIKETVLSAPIPVNYTYHVGQYLPTWHTYENYKDFFVSDKRTNGCREIFAIELPWIIDTFGKIVKYTVQKGNMTSLDIDYPDNYQLILEHENGSKGTLTIDVASIKAVRKLEIYSETVYLEWDGTPDGLSVYNVKTGKTEKKELYKDTDTINLKNATIIENAYQSELEEFFAVIREGKTARYSFERDLETLNLIDSIEG